MDTKEIILICAGCLFVILLVVYAVSYFRRDKRDMQEKRMLEQAYTAGDVAKMEYDIAFYDVDMFDGKTDEADRQMTIDDVSSAPSADDDKAVEEAILAHVDDEGVEEITGNYNPEKEG